MTTQQAAPYSRAGTTGSADARYHAELIEQVVVKAFGLTIPDLRSPTRGRKHIAFARQIAVYAMHVHFGHSLSLTARQFGRDRTTVAHACRLVEDRRDEPTIGRIIGSIEEGVAHCIALGGGPGQLDGSVAAVPERGGGEARP